MAKSSYLPPNNKTAKVGLFGTTVSGGFHSIHWSDTCTVTLDFRDKGCSMNTTSRYQDSVTLTLDSGEHTCCPEHLTLGLGEHTCCLDQLVSAGAEAAADDAEEAGAA